ncbi:MAG: acyl carrier protein [Bacteroidales bacterium]|jgi:acyl carrier protein|nr:acyl carrier protein [Bacteroidales bacterium]MDD4214142.1 acyl carrier protein [Bacteroidales bacterium]
MEINEFVKNFAEQFDDTDMSVFKADTAFRSIEEWSSLIALNIISMVDDEYNIQIKADDIRSSSTIEDLFNIVKAKMQ